MSVVVVGLNHRTTPLSVLEPMTVPPARAAKALHDLAGRDHLSEVVIVSTCLRTEVYAVAGRFHAAMSDIRNFFSAWSGIPPEAFSDQLYSYYDEAAAAHLFKVAAGLDSAVLGESEILGQVGDAWEAARAESAGRAGAVDAVPPGPRGRQAGPVRDGHRPRHHVAVAGGGGGGGGRARVAGGEDDPRARRRRDGRDHGPGPGRSPGQPARCSSPTGRGAGPPSWRPAAAAGPSSGPPCRPPWSRPTSCWPPPGRRTSCWWPPTWNRCSAARQGRPLLIVDIAVPRDVDPAVGALPGVTLLDMDDLTASAAVAMAGRRQEVPRAEAIVAEEVERYLDVAAQRQVAPLVAALHERGEAIRIGELARFRSRLAGLDPAQAAAVEALTRGIVAKLLHEPTVNVKAGAGTPSGEQLARACGACSSSTPDRPGGGHPTLRIATRGSALARWQAEEVGSPCCGRAHPGLDVELVVIATAGDRRQDVPVWEMGGQGVFVKEVQAAVLDGRADLAVHSAKDLPSSTAQGLVLAAVPARADPRDALVGLAAGRPRAGRPGGDRVGAPAGPAGLAAPGPDLHRAARQHRHPARPGPRGRRRRGGRGGPRPPRAWPTGPPRSCPSP